MTLKITYEMTCDFCKANIGGIDEYVIAPYAPAGDIRLPAPRVAGYGLGQYMGCDSCIHRARESLKATTALK